MNCVIVTVIALPEKVSGGGLAVDLLVKSNGDKHESMNTISPLDEVVATPEYTDGE